MRIVTWNCQGAFRKKANAILSLTPDVLVVQECEHPDKLKFSSSLAIPKDFYWHSDGGKKGIGIFSYCDFKFELLPQFNSEFRYILPFNLKNDIYTIRFFAIWAMNNKENYDARYIGQIWLAINYYQNLLNDSTILIGDFNSNKIWDYKGRVGNHTDVVNLLKEKSIYSVYHKQYEIEHGKETHPTLFMYRKKEKPYHIDYCFMSEELIKRVEKVEIGAHEKWSALSDHSPLAVELDL